jgi:hypothetical protein
MKVGKSSDILKKVIDFPSEKEINGETLMQTYTSQNNAVWWERGKKRWKANVDFTLYLAEHERCFH